jgi:hypothetical protein
MDHFILIEFINVVLGMFTNLIKNVEKVIYLTFWATVQQYNIYHHSEFFNGHFLKII